MMSSNVTQGGSVVQFYKTNVLIIVLVLILLLIKMKLDIGYPSMKHAISVTLSVWRQNILAAVVMILGRSSEKKSERKLTPSVAIRKAVLRRMDTSEVSSRVKKIKSHVQLNKKVLMLQSSPLIYFFYSADVCRHATPCGVFWYVGTEARSGNSRSVRPFAVTCVFVGVVLLWRRVVDARWGRCHEGV